MKKEAYLKLMGLKKIATEKGSNTLKQRGANFYSTGIPETPTQQYIFTSQATKDNPLPLLAQKQIADKLGKKWGNRTSLGHQFKRKMGLTDDSNENYYNSQTRDYAYPVYDAKTGWPFIDGVRNWWRFLTKGK